MLARVREVKLTPLNTVRQILRNVNYFTAKVFLSWNNLITIHTEKGSSTEILSIHPTIKFMLSWNNSLSDRSELFMGNSKNDMNYPRILK